MSKLSECLTKNFHFFIFAGAARRAGQYVDSDLIIKLISGASFAPPKPHIGDTCDGLGE